MAELESKTRKNLTSAPTVGKTALRLEKRTDRGRRLAEQSNGWILITFVLCSAFLEPFRGKEWNRFVSYEKWVRVWENNRFSLSSRPNPSLNVSPSCFASIESERERSMSFHCNIHSDHEAFSNLCSVVSRFGYLLLLVKYSVWSFNSGATYVSRVLRCFLLGWFTMRAGNRVRISARSSLLSEIFHPSSILSIEKHF